MSEILKIILTAAFTIIGGVIVYALSQIISKFIIDPIHEQNKIRGEIADALIFYANVYCYPGRGKPEKMDEASERLRQLATLLQSKTHLIPWYKAFEKIKFVRPSRAIEEASAKLIGLSHGIHIPPEQCPGLSFENSKCATRIKELLGLRINL